MMTDYSGAWVMVNDIDNKVLIGTSQRAVEGYKQKHYAVLDYIARRRRWGQISDIVQKDIDKRDGDIFNRSYIFIANKREIIKYINKKYKVDHTIANRIVQHTLKLFIALDLFGTYESYSHKIYIDTHKEKYINAEDISDNIDVADNHMLFELISKGFINAYEVLDIENNKFKKLDFLQTQLNSLTANGTKETLIFKKRVKNIRPVVEDKEVVIESSHIVCSKNIQYKDDIVIDANSRLAKLLKIESILRGKSIERLIEDYCVSEKAKEINNIIAQLM